MPRLAMPSTTSSSLPSTPSTPSTSSPPGTVPGYYRLGEYSNISSDEGKINFVDSISTIKVYS
jgi:hypothetical protein